MLPEKAGKRATRNRGRYQVAQSLLNRLYVTQNTEIAAKALVILRSM